MFLTSCLESETHMDDQRPQGRGPLSTRKSRRTVVKAAAWSAPAIAVVSAAPAIAATPPPPTGAFIGASNFGDTQRGFVVMPMSPGGPTTFAAGTVITLTVTGPGTISGLTISGGSFSPAITQLTAGTYTINATTGATQFSITGNLTPTGATLTASASLVWSGPPSGSASTGSTTTIPTV